MHHCVSVVCVSYNDLPNVERLISSLEKQSYHNFELVIVDNARNTKLEAYLGHLQARSSFDIAYVPSNTNTGYAGGNVTGVKHAKGDLLFVLNSDTRLEKNALELLCKEFTKREKRVMVLVPKIMIRDSEIIHSVGMRRIRETENLYMNIGYLEWDRRQYDEPRRVEAFDGPAFMLRKDLLRHTYLFDPRFFFGNETNDLAERILKLGFEMWTCPSAIVRHEIRGTVSSAKLSEDLNAFIVRNTLVHTWKNMGWKMFWHTFLVGILYRNIFGRLITGYKRRAAITYIKGVAMFIRDLGSFSRPLKE